MAGGGWRVWELSCPCPSMSLALNCIWSHQHHSKSSLLAHTVGRHMDRGLHTVSGDRTNGDHRWWTQSPTAAGPQIQTWTLVAVRDPDIAMAPQSTCVNMALVAPRPSDINTASDGCTAFGSNTSHESHETQAAVGTRTQTYLYLNSGMVWMSPPKSSCFENLIPKFPC